MDQLEKELQFEITKKVTEDFKDPLGPLTALTTAALAPMGNYGEICIVVIIIMYAYMCVNACVFIFFIP